MVYPFNEILKILHIFRMKFIVNEMCIATGNISRVADHQTAYNVKENVKLNPQNSS